MDEIMTIEEAKKISKLYASYDEEFRRLKKQKDFRLASVYKEKRDALSGKLSVALAVLRNANTN